MTRMLLNTDLSQAELRVMAILSGDPWMQKALQETSGDFFDNHLMPVAFPQRVAHFGDVYRWKEEQPVEHKESRTKVKAVVYGLSFGRQANAIGKAIGMPTWEAQNIIDNYLGTAVLLNEWRERVQYSAVTPNDRDFLINPFGRKFQSEIITTRNYRNIQREALSFLPQSTSSDILLATAIRVNPQIEAVGCKLINLVHDAMMIEGDSEALLLLGPYLQQELRKTGAAVLGNTVPFLSEWSMGKSWADLD